jgi:hypothetical protein
MASNTQLKKASERIPILARHAVSERAQKTLDIVGDLICVAYRMSHS